MGAPRSRFLLTTDSPVRPIRFAPSARRRPPCFRCRRRATQPDPALHDQALDPEAGAFRTVMGGGRAPAYAAYLKSVLVAGGYEDANLSADSRRRSDRPLPGTDPRRSRW